MISQAQLHSNQFLGACLIQGLSTVTNFTVEIESVWSLLQDFNGVLRGQITQKIASIYAKNHDLH